MLHWKLLLSIEEDIIQLSNNIEFHKDNYETYSTQILKVILTIGSEIDTTCKELLSEIDKTISYKTIKEHKKGIVKHLPEIMEEPVFIFHNSLAFVPWEQLKKTDSKGNIESPKWWLSYNDVKHVRNDTLKSASLETLLNSFAALVIVNFYRLKNKHPELNSDVSILNRYGSTKLFKMDGKYHPRFLIV